MRILLLTDQWNRIGGLEGVTVEIAKGLIALGHDVQVSSQLDSGVVEQDGIAALGLAPGSRLLLSPYMRFYWSTAISRYVARLAPSLDLVFVCHIRLLEAALNGLAQVGGRRPRCVAWTHGSEVWGSEGRRYSGPLALADTVVGVSKFTVGQLSEFTPYERLVVIPNMVDTNVFVPLENPAEVRQNNILIVSRLSSAERSKGHMILFEALAILKNEYRLDCSVTVIGDGNDRPALEAAATALPQGHCIEFLGRVPRQTLVNCYQRCAVFAMPSRVDRHPDRRWTGEGFGLVYIEAAACGRPVVASCEGGAPETIVDGETGFLVDPRSPQCVADAIAHLLNDPELAACFGANGRRWVVNNFTTEHFQRRLAALVSAA